LIAKPRRSGLGRCGTYRGCPSIWTAAPDPARDLFRPDPTEGGLVRSTFENKLYLPGGIDWENLVQFCEFPAPRGRAGQISFEVSREQLIKLLPKKQAKRGRKPYDRAAISAEVWRLMDYRGDFVPEDRAWRSLSQLIRKLENKFDISRSTLAEMVSPMVEAWRKNKSEN
jgi:hypothetical protein